MIERFLRRKLTGGDPTARLASMLGGDTAAVIESALGNGGLGVQSAADRQLLEHGLEGQGVITERRVLGGKGRNAVFGAYIAVEGHITLDDRSVATFSSSGLDTSELGDLNVGTIVPVRYDAESRQVVLDIVKLQATKQGENDAAAASKERRDAERIAAADAQLARHQGQPAS